MLIIQTQNGRSAAAKETCKYYFINIIPKLILKIWVLFRCNERNTTTTGTVSSTEPTTTTTGLVCEGFEQETNTRRIMACPDGDEFCIALENKFVVYERDPDGNPTSEVAQNITQGMWHINRHLEIKWEFYLTQTVAI